MFCCISHICVLPHFSHICLFYGNLLFRGRLLNRIALLKSSGIIFFIKMVNKLYFVTNCPSSSDKENNVVSMFCVPKTTLKNGRK